MNTYKKAINHVKKVVSIVGDQKTGWFFPTGTNRDDAFSLREELFDIEIYFDGSGYLLCYSTDDKALYGDSWHLTEIGAKQAAFEEFGVKISEWS